jgi:hypothetical protein
VACPDGGSLSNQVEFVMLLLGCLSGILTGVALAVDVNAGRPDLGAMVEDRLAKDKVSRAVSQVHALVMDTS